MYPTTPSAYTLRALLGSGSTCKVYRASVDLPNAPNTAVAVKIMDLSQNDDWDLVFKEVTLMRSMKHENLVNIITSFTEGEQLWVIMSLLQAGSVRSIMQTLAPNGFLNESIISCILAGALNGLAYMHTHSYIHRDVKAGNILLSATGVPKLADFGVAATTSTYNNSSGRKAHTFTGTPCWMAPEVIAQDNEGYGSAADIWSLGITALELAFGFPPYAKLLPLKAMMATMDSDPPTPESYSDPIRCKDISKDFRRFITRALQKDPTRRPSALELLNDPFIRKAPKPEYLVEHLVKLLPASHLGANIGSDAYIPKEEVKNATIQDDSSRGIHCSGFNFETIKHAQRSNASAEVLQQKQQPQMQAQPQQGMTTASPLAPRPQPQGAQGQVHQQPMTPSTENQGQAQGPAQGQGQGQTQMPMGNAGTPMSAGGDMQAGQAQMQMQMASPAALGQGQAVGQPQAQQVQTPTGDFGLNLNMIQQSQKAMMMIQQQLYQLASRVSATQKPEELQMLQQQIGILQQQLQVHQKTIQMHLQIAQQQQQLEEMKRMQQQQQQQQNQQQNQQQ